MTAPADQAVRDQALDPARSFIVQAPAGSGKTELLVQRYLKLLGLVEHPDAVLAITFTRKAAAEMRERVAQSLHESIQGPQSVPPHRRVSLKLAQRVLEQSREREWDLLDNPARLRITTIDSLNSWLAASAPVSSGGGALGNVIEKAETVYAEAARALLRDGMREGDPDVQTVLRHLDGQGRRFTQLVAGMLKRRDQWALLLGEELDPEPLNRWLGTLRQSDIAEMLESLGERKEDFEAVFGLGGAVPSGHATEWKNVASDILTNTGTLRKRKPRDQSEDRFWDAISQSKELKDAISESSEFRQRLRRIAELDRRAYSDEGLRLVQAVLGVLTRAYAQLRLLFASRRETDYIEISQAALEALGHDARPSLLAERLDARLKHILVDEFQDTSATQLMLLQRMVAEWQDGDGRTLFMVGDPMQSIYGFRQADVRGYLQVCERGLSGLRPAVLKLAVNFRSTNELVSWHNKVFPQVFPQRDDPLTAAIAYTPSLPAADASEVASDPWTSFRTTDAAAEGCGRLGLRPSEVRTHFHDKDDDKTEARIMEQIIRETLEQRPEDTVAILVRSRARGEEISHRLGQAGIPINRTEFDPRERFSVVQDLAALARALAQPADRIAWLAVLRAPWCGLSLKDLHALCRNDRKSILWDLMGDAERLARLSADGRARLRRVRAALGEILALRGRLDFRSWVEGAWLALGGPAGDSNPHVVRHAREFLGGLSEVSEGSLIDDAVRRTLELAGQYVSNPETSAPVQLLTMHKAKGLEFDTVILPGLNRRARSNERALLRWWRPPPGRTGSEAAGIPAPLMAVRPGKGAGREDPVYEYLDKLEVAKEDAERRRLLYVAATRARSRLHLMVGLQREKSNPQQGKFVPRARTMAQDLRGWLTEESADAGELPAAGPPASGRRLAKPVIRRVPDGWTPPKPPAPLIAPSPEEIQSPTYAWAGERARVLGLTVHRWLQEIAREGPDAYSRERLQALRARTRRVLQFHGVPADELDSLAADVELALHNTLEDEKGRWTLEPHEDAASELPLSLQEEGRTRSLILDRSFLYKGERWIVDYKTSRHEGGNLDGFLDEEERRHLPQLERYGLAMRAREDRPIRTALYFPWHSAFREVVLDSGAELQLPTVTE